MGIENVETLTEEPIEDEDAAPVRESAQAERERQDAEKAAAIKARQIRLGHIPDPNATEEEETESDSTPETQQEPQPEPQYSGGEVPQQEPQPEKPE